MLTPFSISNLTKSTRSRTNASSIACSSEPTYGAGSGTRLYKLCRVQHQLQHMLQAATGFEAERNPAATLQIHTFLLLYTLKGGIKYYFVNFCFNLNVASAPPKCKNNNID